MFRERSRLPSQHNQQQAQLAGKFLKAIEDEREREREMEYRDELRKLWNRYQKEETDIEKELFNDNENDIESDYVGVNYDDKKKKKSQGGEIAPSYSNEKRSMPLLPWLPASRKKRFPVTKRSPKANENELVKASVAEIAANNEKIAEDLKGIFGSANDNESKKKKKRSMDEAKNKEIFVPQPDHSSMSMMMTPHHLHEDKKRNLKKRNSKDDDEDEEEEEDKNGKLN